MLRRGLTICCLFAFVCASVGAAPRITGTVQRSAISASSPPAQVDTRLGISLDDLAQTTSAVFTDAMKQASPWTSAGPLALSTDGYIARLAPRQFAQTVIYPFASYPSGDYTLLYDGQGTFDIDPRSGSITRVSTGRAIVHVIARPGFGIHLRLTATDPRDYARNMRLILPGFESVYANQPFLPAFLARIAPFNVLRFTQWSHGDVSAVPLTWPERPAVAQFTQAGSSGVAWEYQIALANAAGADPWFVVPVGATNFYVSQLATIVHARLDPRLHAMFEYAPGAWRPGSPVNGYATMAGRNFKLAGDAQTAALDWYSLRSTQVFALVQQAFGADAGRVVRVLGGSPATARSGADAVDRAILSTAAAGQRADIFAVDTTAASPAAIAYTRSLLSGTRMSLAASGGAASLTGIGDAAGSTLNDLKTWRASGGGLFAASSLNAYLAGIGMLTRIPVVTQVQLDALRMQGLMAYARGYPAAHVVPRPLAAQSVMAPMVFPNTYIPNSAKSNVAAVRRAAARPLDSTLGIDINCGGAAVSGTNWVADADFSGGTVSLGTTHAIDTSKVTNPAPQNVYQTARYGHPIYTIAGLTASGTYTVRLHFAEVSVTGSGQRIFSVSINGAPVLTNFDIFATAGGEYIANVQQFSATASTTGTIAIVFASTVNHSLINGIEIIAGTGPTPTPNPSGIDINAGGAALSGTSWVADTDFSGGAVSLATTHAIDTSKVANPAPQNVYQTSRYGHPIYTIAGLNPSATYTVRLHFAEDAHTAAGQRVFSVAINGTQVLTNFDIFAAAGGEYIANIQQFSATASAGGSITLGLTTIVDHALINGIEISSGAVPTPTPTPTTTPPATADFTTYHYDTLRTGWNPSEPILNPANVASAKFALLQTLHVDGLVMAQPLFVANYSVGGTKHNVLIVATEHDSVYAFDADTGVQLWQQSLGTSQATADVGCGDIEPEYGINSTPVIDRSTGRIYVVAATEPSSKVYVTTLWALDIGTGSGNSVRISGSALQSNGSTIAFSDANNMQRASLLLSGGSLYLGIGSHCDHANTNITGWLMQYNASTLTQQFALNTIEDGVSSGIELGGIWGAGFGPAADESGNIYAVTGNGAFDASSNGHNFSMSALKLAPDISTGVQDWFAYKGESVDDVNDRDFGSGGAMVIPSGSGSNPPTFVAMGKSANIYLLNQSNLGHFSSTDAGALGVQNAGSNGSGVWGGPAYYYVPNVGPTIYYQVGGGFMTAYRLLNPTTSPHLSMAAKGTTTSGYGGSIPVVSSNGSTAGTGVVWALRRVAGSGTNNATTTLDAYDATSLSSLASLHAGTWTKTSASCFIAPLVAHGKVYAGGYLTVNVFGLTP